MKNIAVQPPLWFKKTSVYQINPRTFSAEGNIKAITKELPFLARLGVGTVYLCPIFEEDASEDRTYWSDRQKKSETLNPKNPYRMNDYFTIDEEYGTMDDLKECILTAHELGMRFILDLVYLHIGPFAPIIARHPEFAQQDADGNIIYSLWHFPLLDFHSQGLREYLFSNMVYYIGVLDADGFRCDVGDGVPLDFWEEGRRRIQAIKSDAILINEGRKGEYLLTAFDANYGFSWHNAIYKAFFENAPASCVYDTWKDTDSKYPAHYYILRDMDNHDTVTDWPARTEAVAGHDGMELIEVLNYMIDGVPMVYCGNELADTTVLSMFSNRFHPGKFHPTDRNSLYNEENSLRRQEILRKLNTWKSSSPALYDGKTAWLSHDQSEKVIAFTRSSADETVLFIGNLSREDCTVHLDQPVFAKEIVLSQYFEQADSQTVALKSHGYAAIILK